MALLIIKFLYIIIFNRKFFNVANDQEHCIIDDNNNNEVSEILTKINQEINGKHLHKKLGCWVQQIIL